MQIITCTKNLSCISGMHFRKEERYADYLRLYETMLRKEIR